MKRNVMLEGENKPGERLPNAGSRRAEKLWNCALGMAAEIAFTCGLILAGLMISLLSGW